MRTQIDGAALRKAGMAMHRPTPAIAALLAMLCTSWSALETATAQEPQPGGGDPVRGEKLYYDHGCYGCHGFNGQTGARDLVGTGSPLIADAETFIAFLRLRADQAPLFPSTRMPNYPESALTDAEARDIFAYVRSFELDAPDVEDIPALQAILDSAARPRAPQP